MSEADVTENPHSDPAGALRQWRTSRDLSQKAAGEQVGVSGPAWHDWETGGRVPSGGYREALEILTGIPATAWRSPAEVRAVESARRSAAAASAEAVETDTTPPEAA